MRRSVSALTIFFFAGVYLTPAQAGSDVTPPRVVHEALISAVTGVAVDIQARFQDESALFEPKLYFRHVGERRFRTSDCVMMSVKTRQWVCTIPAAFVSYDIEYFLEAFDIYGNGPGRHGSPEKPHLIKITLDGQSPQRIETRPKVDDPLSANHRMLERAQVSAAASPPVYKAWWFWTIVGVAAVGATLGVLCATKTGLCAASKPIDQVTLRVSGGDPRDGL